MDPAIGTYAKDITKSFIQDGLTSNSDVQSVLQLLHDVYYRPTPGASPRLHPDNAEDLGKLLIDRLDLGQQVTARLGSGPKVAPDLPEVYSRGYAVYIGERPSFSVALTRTRFSMRNAETETGERLLTIAFDRP
jgi:hypothetical protein